MESKRHMREGIARMEQGDWLTALRHFDRAVELREARPWHDDVESAWVLAAAWINRSDVLRFLGSPEEGIRSLDRAIDAMHFVRLEENPGYANRLILAWINRGTACGEARQMEEALDGFSTAEKLMETWGGPTTPERKLMASMLHANRSRILLDTGRTIDGWTDAQMAVTFLEGLEPVPVVTEAAIQARGILCRALALLLDEPRGAGQAEDWIALATDAAEEALALVHSSGYRGVWVADLVRYGARIYRICQPHFLGEFIREWVTADGPLVENSALKCEMANELLLARADLERRVRLNPHETERVQRAIKTLLSLQLAEAELAVSWINSPE
ncbi:MAG: tetratricopeptide repeat protein [Verrucomicrobiota bacterium]